jgi:protein TonB
MPCAGLFNRPVWNAYLSRRCSVTTLLAAPGVPNANERFKESFAARVWLSLILATLLHLLPFRYWPEMEAENWGPLVADVMEAVQLPPLDLPAAPAPMRGPPVPVLSTDVSVTETLPIVSWDQARELPAPPPDVPAAASGGAGIFVPITVAPKLANPDQVERTLVREYPASLRDAGIGGTVDLLVHIDEEGRVTEASVGGGSGYDILDRAALRVADAMRFHPAQNRDLRVAVWIRLPVTFQVR